MNFGVCRTQDANDGYFERCAYGENCGNRLDPDNLRMSATSSMSYASRAYGYRLMRPEGLEPPTF